jgi:hypothetical protein
MLLRRNQKPPDESGISSLAWSSNSPQGKDLGRSKTGTGRFPDCSRLSTRMVELSLEQAQRDLTLHDVVANNATPASLPFLGTSTDETKPAGPHVISAAMAGTIGGREAVNGTAHLNPQAAQGTPREWKNPYFAVPHSWATVAMRRIADYWSRSPVIGILRRGWVSVQKDHRFSIFRTATLSRVRLAAQYTDHLRDRTRIFVGQWSRRSAQAFQFLRVPEGVKTVTQLELLRHLKQSPSKLRMLTARLRAASSVIRREFGSVKPYRCRDCGGKVGFRSRPHSSIERYILPLLLTQAVRCAECFRRDYRLIFTPVRESLPPHDEAGDPIHRNAA